MGKYSEDDLLLFFDTETTNIPKWKEPSENDDQPHIVEIAALLVEENTRMITQSLSVIITPDGWKTSPEALAIHGITHEYALKNGVPELAALDIFLCMWDLCAKRLAFGTTFDNRMIRIGTKRFFSEIAQDKWKAGAYECIMSAARKDMGGKNPKLVDAYQHYMGKPMKGAHSAMGDTIGCMDVWFKIKDSQNN